MKYLLMSAILLWVGIANANDVSFLKDVSVRISADGNSGSGFILNKELLVAGKPQKISFVFTAGHVVVNCTTTKTEIDGIVKIEDKYRPVVILTENNLFIGHIITYSPAEENDISVLVVSEAISTNSISFENPPALGIWVNGYSFLYGEVGEGSLSAGIVSKFNKYVNGEKGKLPFAFDQYNLSSVSGSSGSAVFYKNNVIGMVVRINPTGDFSFAVPAKTIKNYLSKEKLGWLVDDSSPPSYEEVLKLIKGN